MHHPSIKHTLEIFERLYNHVEPVLNAEMKDEMLQAYEQMRDNHTLSLDELEDTMIVFGKKVWPYRKALEEFVGVYEGRTGEQLLRNALSAKLRERYDEFIACGGDLHTMRSGIVASFFEPEERVELSKALVESSRAVRDHALQATKSTDKDDFDLKVDRFHEVLAEIEHHLDALRDMADEEQEHPHLADEMRTQVRAFEYGLSLLGPEMVVDSITDSREYYDGRKKELRVMPGV